MASALEFGKKAVVENRAVETKAVSLYSQLRTTVLQVHQDLTTKTGEAKTKALVILRNPEFQTCTIATSGGTVILGAAGGMFGLASGVVVGSAAGVVPALFTFGLSIPVGGAIVGFTGLCTGTLVGGAAGGAAGFTTYKYRLQIKHGAMIVKVRAEDMVKSTKQTATLMLINTKAKVDEQVCFLKTTVTDLATKSTTKTVEVLNLAAAKAFKGYELATTTKVGVTSTAAIAGAVVGGAATGTFGTVAGAVVGIVPAIFTFGLSIPAGAVVGGCVGTVIGGSVGAVGGGALGYGGFTHRKILSRGWSKANKKAGELKVFAITRASDAKVRVQSVVSGSTGGTDKSL